MTVNRNEIVPADEVDRRVQRMRLRYEKEGKIRPRGDITVRYVEGMSKGVRPHKLKTRKCGACGVSFVSPRTAATICSVCEEWGGPDAELSATDYLK